MLWTCPGTDLSRHTPLGHSSQTCACNRIDTSSGWLSNAWLPAHLVCASISKFHQSLQCNYGILFCFSAEKHGQFVVDLWRRILNIKFFYVLDSLNNYPNRDKHICMWHTIFTHQVCGSSSRKVTKHKSQPNTCCDAAILEWGEEYNFLLFYHPSGGIYNTLEDTRQSWRLV